MLRMKTNEGVALVIVGFVMMMCSSLHAVDYLKYDSLNEPKAKGLHFTMEYPGSWKAEPGERPNIVQRITSENGKGLQVATILVKDARLPKGHRFTSQEYKELYSRESMIEFVPKGSKVVAVRQTKLDGEIAGYICYVSPFERANVAIVTKNESYVVFFRDKVILLTFMVAAMEGAGASERLDQEYERHRLMFQRMAGSLIIQSKWK